MRLHHFAAQLAFAIILSAFAQLSLATAGGRCVGGVAGEQQTLPAHIEVRNATDNFRREPYFMSIGRGDRRVYHPISDAVLSPEKIFVGAAPNSVLAQSARFESSVFFGYRLAENKLRKNVVADRVHFNEAGEIVAVEVAHKLMRRELIRHSAGRKFYPLEKKRIQKLNGQLFDVLRNHPDFQEKLAEFVQDRGWPKTLAKKARLVYFDSAVFDVVGWARQNGYTKQELVDSGWAALHFDRQGRPEYRVLRGPSIKIPFVNAENKIVSFRTRNLEKEARSRYLSWPHNRSITNHNHKVEKELYNSNALNTAKGKTVVITEGEFKTIVANEFAPEIVTVGINGIHRISRLAIQKIVQSGAQEVIVLFDRDPVAKAIRRVDRVTDSQREAYDIALKLQAAGHSNVRVGRLPDVFSGDKVGLDDLILAKGPELFRKAVESALEPAAYAYETGIHPQLHRISRELSLRRRILKHYRFSEMRGGRKVDDQTVETLKEEIAQLKTEQAALLAKNYNGAYRFHQPDARYDHLPAVPHGKRSRAKERYRDEIVLLDYVLDANGCYGCLKSQVTLNDLNLAFYELQRGQPISNETIAKTLLRGLEYAKERSLPLQKSPENFYELMDLYLLGMLAEKFPTSDYSIEFRTKIYNALAGNPLEITFSVVSKSNEKVQAFAHLTARSEGIALNESPLPRTWNYLRP